MSDDIVMIVVEPPASQWIDGDVRRPQITDELLAERLARLTPLGVDSEGVIHRITIPDLRTIAYTWSPELLEPVRFTPLMESHTDHTCAYHGFFKPTIAEVLAQVPEDLPEGCNAFYTDKARIEIYKTGEGHRGVTVWGRVDSDG